MVYVYVCIGKKISKHNFISLTCSPIYHKLRTSPVFRQTKPTEAGATVCNCLVGYMRSMPYKVQHWTKLHLSFK